LDPKEHWEHIYVTKRASDVSWFQTDPHVSLAFIRRVAPDIRTTIADVGGGASTLVDGLLQAGYRNITVLDISAAALAQARDRLADSANLVNWIVANALDPALPQAGIDFWHDRAVFHFLTESGDRVRYVEQVRRAVRPGGHVLIATFAEDGPQKCSGLNVARYSTTALKAQFGEQFDLVSSEREDHVTPAGIHQSFQYCLLRYVPPAV
jgi:ubiquinone/menaquinone biosynthesis C-methylase UbiE